MITRRIQVWIKFSKYLNSSTIVGETPQLHQMITITKVFGDMKNIKMKNNGREVFDVSKLFRYLFSTFLDVSDASARHE